MFYNLLYIKSTTNPQVIEQAMSCTVVQLVVQEVRSKSKWFAMQYYYNAQLSQICRENGYVCLSHIGY